MADNATALATLVFAAMAGIGSLVRISQNERFYHWNRKMHAHKRSQRRYQRREDGFSGLSAPVLMV